MSALVSLFSLLESVAYPIEVIFDVRRVRTRIPVPVVTVFAVVRMRVHIWNAVSDACDDGAVVDDARALEVVEDDIADLQLSCRCGPLRRQPRGGCLQIPPQAVGNGPAVAPCFICVMPCATTSPAAGNPPSLPPVGRPPHRCPPGPQALGNEIRAVYGK